MHVFPNVKDAVLVPSLFCKDCKATKAAACACAEV